MSDVTKVYPVLNSIGESLRAAVKAGRSEEAAHLAGVSRATYDPDATIPEIFPVGTIDKSKCRPPGF